MGYLFDADSDQALIELYLLDKIITGKQVASAELVDRCKKIKKRLIEFPGVVSKINSFFDLRFTKWAYEPLLKERQYIGKSSVRLTKADRLIFDEIADKEITIIEELLHYKENLTREMLEKKLKEKPTLTNKLNLELFDILKKYTFYNLENYKQIINILINKAIKDKSKIWFFD